MWRLLVDPNKLKDEPFDLEAAAQVITALSSMRSDALLSAHLCRWIPFRRREDAHQNVCGCVGCLRCSTERCPSESPGFLLQELAAGLRNRDALTEAGAELGLTDDDINNVIQ